MSPKFMSRLDQIGETSCECGPGCCGMTEEKNLGRENDLATLRKARWITGWITSGAGSIPVVSTTMTSRDRLGHWRVRWGIGRMRYLVPPGLYAVGAPDAWSPVFVSANFKLSFDVLRTSLDGMNGWIIVLDTKGINVWCAAGKGTFGTDELVRRIEETGLTRVVSPRTLVLPQLGAPNVAAHEVAKRSKFRVVYGPVRAGDIKAFMDAGMKATPEMRLVRFGLKDRLVLTPVELSGVIRNKFFLGFVLAWALGLLGVQFLRLDGPAIFGAIIVGTILTPALLPWIPGRAFAGKGGLLGLLWAALVIVYRGFPPSSVAGWAAVLSYVFILPAISAFLAMSFTGSSTYTSLSGVVKEMKTAVPLIAASTVLGIAATAALLFLKG